MRRSECDLNDLLMAKVAIRYVHMESEARVDIEKLVTELGINISNLC